MFAIEEVKRPLKDFLSKSFSQEILKQSLIYRTPPKTKLLQATAQICEQAYSRIQPRWEVT